MWAIVVTAVPEPRLPGPQPIPPDLQETAAGPRVHPMPAGGSGSRTMQIVAVTNIKGGVGKTTTAVNLSYLAARDGRATVLWDLDPQGAATYLLRGEPNERASARKLVSGRRELPELLATTPWDNLWLIPADRSYRNFDLHLNERKHATERLLRMTRPLQAACSLLVLDCPPGMSLLTENVLRAADALLVPMVPAPLSMRMLDELLGFVERNGWTDLCVLPFFSMVDLRRTLHAESIAYARLRHPQVLRTAVPDWSDIERMTARRAPLPAIAPRSPAAQVYETLWAEVRTRLPAA